MARHILDHPRAASAPRLPEFLDLGRKETGPHPTSRTLVRRARAEPARLGIFQRLARRRDAADT